VTARDWVEVILALAIIINPIALLIYRSKAKRADGKSFGLGVRVVQYTGATTLPPMVIILALEGLIDSSTVAALVGAFVGYLFSGLAEFDRRKSEG